MTDIRIQVAIFKTGDLPRDHFTNTVYFRDLNPSGAQTNFQTLADATRDVFRGRLQHPAGFQVQAKAYDMDDAEPRPIKAIASPQPVTQASASNSGPREVALCLSYFSEVNQPRSRGRIYIGPFTDAAMEERPPAGNAITPTAGLAAGLANVGGVDVDWSLYSPTTAALPGSGGGLKKITNWWVDNEWDTIRSRGRRATSRQSGVTNE